MEWFVAASKFSACYHEKTFEAPRGILELCMLNTAMDIHAPWNLKGGPL